MLLVVGIVMIVTVMGTAQLANVMTHLNLFDFMTDVCVCARLCWVNNVFVYVCVCVSGCVLGENKNLVCVFVCMCGVTIWL